MQKSARFSLPGIFSAYNYKELNISRSYYNKIKNSLVSDDYIPKKVLNKLFEVDAKLRKPKVIYNYSSVNIKVSKYTITKLNKNKENYIWVKFKLSSKTRTYYQSFVMLSKDIKELQKKINEYIKVMIKKYDTNPVYLNGITIQTV